MGAVSLGTKDTGILMPGWGGGGGGFQEKAERSNSSTPLQVKSWGWPKGLQTNSGPNLGSGLEAQMLSSGAGRRLREGSTPQISRAYWAMVLSLENLPDVAMFRITIRVHSLGFLYKALTFSWHLM